MTKAIYVWYWFIFLPYVCPFLKKLCWTIYCWLCKQNITWLRWSVRKRKAETVQSDIVGNYPRSKLPFAGYHKTFLLIISKFLTVTTLTLKKYDYEYLKVFVNESLQIYCAF